ncbi:hypothetical protein BC777_0868 [Yoonia maricola]|uniref:Uncharacterized protein n=1 Tax=Yoonia maricola TaxID=420999 RepID=A0A2M8WM71_9RHOB|nr:DNA polymerase III subunit chi [Yoonia maricola]PJI92025.1 hypothetical protein BC777_0868 [Yoonia maricola]
MIRTFALLILLAACEAQPAQLPEGFDSSFAF